MSHDNCCCNHKALFAGGKLLVYSSAKFPMAEVVDISNEHMICDLKVNDTLYYLLYYAGAIGGRMNGRFVFCGGSRNYNNKDWITDCCFDLLNPTIDDDGYM